MSKLRVLVIGSGGREHALAWALARSEQVGQVYVAPGNAGTEWASHTGADGVPLAPSHNAPIPAVDTSALLRFAREQSVDLTVVGPEIPLAAGIVDAFQAAGMRVFGPTRAAARLESSKAFAKQFMRAHGIPTADFMIFDDCSEAHWYVEKQERPLVIKADGLAAGKGVIVCHTVEEALDALHLIMIEKAFGPGGARVVIEEVLEGEEISVLAFADGSDIAIMPYAADHKRALDGDQGANTGGMGAYAPRHPSADLLRQLNEVIEDGILRTTVQTMAHQGTPFHGVLYAGLMLTPQGPRVLEFNCRFGDPETQVVLPLLKGDLAEILLACTEGRLSKVQPQWREDTCSAVVLASAGYPGEYPTGVPITGLDQAAALPDVYVFHAGTALRDGQIVTAGGRVLAVSALGGTLPAALDRAYDAIGHIEFEGVHFRRDIGRTLRERA